MTKELRIKYILEVYKQNGNCSKVLIALQLSHALCSECPLAEADTYLGEHRERGCFTRDEAKERAYKIINTFTPGEIVEALL